MLKLNSRSDIEKRSISFFVNSELFSSFASKNSSSSTNFVYESSVSKSKNDNLDDEVFSIS